MRSFGAYLFVRVYNYVCTRFLYFDLHTHTYSALCRIVAYAVLLILIL